MKIRVVGSSCSWFLRNNTSFIIDDDIIFDVPSGAYKDIIGYINLKDIKAVLISHFHADHFGDFNLIAARFMREFKRNEKLKVYAPKGALDRLIKFNEILCAGKDEITAENFLNNIDFIDLYDGFEFKVNNYTIISYKVNHGYCDAYGFVMKDENGKTVGFSADTAECDNLFNIVSQSNYAFVDMASVDSHKKHLSIENVENLIKNYPNCKIYPVHTNDITQEYARQNMNFVEDGQLLEF